jgi:hypothetical protein
MNFHSTTLIIWITDCKRLFFFWILSPCTVLQNDRLLVVFIVGGFAVWRAALGARLLGPGTGIDSHRAAGGTHARTIHASYRAASGNACSFCRAVPGAPVLHEAWRRAGWRRTPVGLAAAAAPHSAALFAPNSPGGAEPPRLRRDGADSSRSVLGYRARASSVLFTKAWGGRRIHPSVRGTGCQPE